jgi:hypothetical protein
MRGGGALDAMSRSLLFIRVFLVFSDIPPATHFAVKY